MRTQKRLVLATFVVTCVMVLVACERKAEQKAPSRFQGVQSSSSSSSGKELAEKKFCEVSFPGSGEGSRLYSSLQERPLPVGKAKIETKKLKWVNFWATWCGPCVEEIPLLKRWEKSLNADGLPVAVEYWSADDDEAALSRWLGTEMANGVNARWLKTGSLLSSLDMLGIDKNSPIPVHAFIDKNNYVRCVRVGAVSESDYPTIKTLFDEYR